ncbi:hypothetical protein ERD32_06055 [Lactobacillus crispatus]|uniref:Uncharacterized protein n=2 Tax=Lactobacillus crispatus TaxID=47770 RepID=A0A4Q0LP58_9LACO|nr:hypothetical protein HMPREF0508_01095 [Lactobacillus crispatus MV-3A-US]KWU06013.1 hypothetical protein AEL96_05735 [Lactobacillus crispatus]KWU07954.1 hypothetical protein AEL99_08810 [Lactobacillus crispatus]MBG0732297.1 hypothetical protein [Lactobacillus crispatus]MCT3535119.1 hypothetical protein [Lactobacillus crispatus]
MNSYSNKKVNFMIDNEQRAHDLTLLILQNHWDDLEAYGVKIHAKPHVLDAYASLYPEILKWTKKQNF